MSRGPVAALAPAHHAVAAIHAPSAQRLGIARRVHTAGPAVAITFDDGPHPEGTPAILEILAAHGAVATFFLVGEQVERRPELARRIHDAGHAIGLHGYRHLLQTRRRADAQREDYARGIGAIEDAVGISPTRHRPPYGAYSPMGLRLARHRGLAPLLWTTWGKDWRRFTTPARIAANALRRTGADAGMPIAAGDVILLHDADFYSVANSHRRTADALAIILAELTQRGLDTVRAS